MKSLMKRSVRSRPCAPVSAARTTLGGIRFHALKEGFRVGLGNATKVREVYAEARPTVGASCFYV